MARLFSAWRLYRHYRAFALPRRYSARRAWIVSSTDTTARR